MKEGDSRNVMNAVLERRVHDSKTGLEISREKVLRGRKAEMEELTNHHIFDKVPESEAVMRVKWLNDDRGEKARERLIAMEITALEGERDDSHAMTPPL